MSRCLDPQTPPEKVFRGSKHLLIRYLGDFGRLGKSHDSWLLKSTKRWGVSGKMERFYRRNVSCVCWNLWNVSTGLTADVESPHWTNQHRQINIIGFGPTLMSDCQRAFSIDSKSQQINVILLMEKILHHLGCINLVVNNGINWLTTYQLAQDFFHQPFDGKGIHIFAYI